MKIQFWGVRGSLPTPITPQQIQSKIMAAIQRATPEDLQSEDSRAKFVSNLPSWIFGTTGGNTPCVEIKSDNTEIILDAGTGIRLLGKSQELPENNKYNLLLEKDTMLWYSTSTIHMLLLCGILWRLRSTLMKEQTILHRKLRNLQIAHLKRWGMKNLRNQI